MTEIEKLNETEISKAARQLLPGSPNSGRLYLAQLLEMLAGTALLDPEGITWNHMTLEEVGVAEELAYQMSQNPAIYPYLAGEDGEIEEAVCPQEELLKRMEQLMATTTEEEYTQNCLYLLAGLLDNLTQQTEYELEPSLHLQ